MRRIYKEGRSTAGWRRAGRVTDIAELRTGDVLVLVSDRFRAENLAVVTAESKFPHKPGKIVYMSFCADGKAEGWSEFARWSWEVDGGPIASDRIFRAVREPRRARAEVR